MNYRKNGIVEKINKKSNCDLDHLQSSADDNKMVFGEL